MSASKILLKGPHTLAYPHPSLHFTPPQGDYSNCHRNLNSPIYKAFEPISDAASDPEIWCGLIAEHCDRQDKHRLRECLEGLRADNIVTDPQRQEIWRGLPQECRGLCHTVAGGKRHG